MNDSSVENAVKKVIGVAGGGIVGGTILAPLAVAGVAALGVATAPIAVPLAGAAILLGMWGGHKATE